MSGSGRLIIPPAGANLDALASERAITIQTRLGNDIENTIYKEFPEERRRLLDDQMQRRIEGFGLDLARRVHQRRRASLCYNCHGLTFANRRANIEPDTAVELVLHDDGYGVVDPGDLQPGDIVVYHAPHGIEHTGVVTHVARPMRSASPDVLVVSKWGKLGEYVHPVHAYPGSFDGVTYLREGIK